MLPLQLKYVEVQTQLLADGPRSTGRLQNSQAVSHITKMPKKITSAVNGGAGGHTHLELAFVTSPPWPGTSTMKVKVGGRGSQVAIRGPLVMLSVSLEVWMYCQDEN